MSLRTGVDIEHAPARVSGALAVVSGLIVVIASGFTSVLALLFGLLGLVGLASGIFALQSRRSVVVSTAVLFIAVLVSGVMGNATELLLASGIGTILALDLGQNAVSVGRQMTTDTYTRRGEIVHAGVSALVGVVITAIGYGIYLLSAGGQPVAALALLLLATVLLIWSFRT